MGYIYYQTNIWVDNEIFRYGMIGLVAAVGATIFLAVACVLVKRRSRTKKRKTDGSQKFDDVKDSARYTNVAGTHHLS